MFGAATGQTGTTPNLFANAGTNNLFTQQTTNTGFPAAGGTNQTPNLFANTGATNQQVFAPNPTATGAPNAGTGFFNPLNTPGQNTGAGGNLFNTQATNPNPPTANLFGNTPATTTNTPNLFGTAGTGAPGGMGGPNLFGTQQQTATFPNNPMQPNVMANPGYVDQQQNIYKQALEFIILHKKGDLKKMVENSYMELSEDNLFKNQRLSTTGYPNLKNAFLNIVKEVTHLEKNIQYIVDRNKQLFAMMDSFNNVTREKLSFYKKCFLQVSSKSNAITQIKGALDEFEKLAQTQFDSFYQSIKNNRYTLPVVTPSDFEMRLSEYTLKQAQNLLEKLNDYERCQQSTETATYIDVVPALIQYYKNVTSLVFEFREKYEKFKDMVRRNTGSGFVDIQGKVNAQKSSLTWRSSITFSLILDIEMKLNQKIQHCSEMKKKFKIP